MSVLQCCVVCDNCDYCDNDIDSHSDENNNYNRNNCSNKKINKNNNNNVHYAIKCTVTDENKYKSPRQKNLKASSTPFPHISAPYKDVPA